MMLLLLYIGETSIVPSKDLVKSVQHIFDTEQKHLVVYRKEMNVNFCL